MQQTYTSLQKRRNIVLISSILITIVYWFVALWYTNKGPLSKDLVVFHWLFGGTGPWLDLWQYIYQFTVTVILFWLLPLTITRYYLKENFTNLGLKAIYSREAILVCAIVYPLVIASTYFSSQEAPIAAEYPLSKLIGTSWGVFIAYQLAYMFYFIAYEIFYRGYLQFGLKSDNPTTRELIVIALIQTVLTTLFHIGKPSSEILAAAAFGPVFGYVTFRYGTIWYVMVIHYVMNIFLDLFSLHWHHLLPQKPF